MRTWPALDVQFDTVGAGISRPDLFQASLADYDVAAIEERSDDDWRVFFQTMAERDRALPRLRDEFADVAIDPIDVPDDDWAARSQANLRAVRVGALVVAPPWDVPRVGVKSDAASAGGSEV